MTIYAFDLQNVRQSDIDDVADQYQYNHFYEKRFVDAFKHTMRVIHGIPHAFSDVHLGEANIYIGRSFFGTGGVLQRFKAHHNKRSSQYGVIAFCCPTAVIPQWEKACINIIDGVKSTGKLCVAGISNGHTGSVGGMPSTDLACVYVTWNIVERTRIQYPSQNELDEIAANVSQNIAIPRNSIRNAIDIIRYPNRDYLDSIVWHPNSR